jgi:dihydropteroate synthase
MRGVERLEWKSGRHTLALGDRTLIMGVLNVTPDSFSDGGRFFDPDLAVARGHRMVEEGADLVDVGGESTRPGTQPVSVTDELGRVLPVIGGLNSDHDVPISVDTRKMEVAAAAVEAGASIVNDISAGATPGMFDVVRDSGAGMVLMHMRGEPSTMQDLTDYEDVVGEVRDHLRARMRAAVDGGIDPNRLALDPGLGFAKTFEQNLVLMRHADAFLELGRPLVVGPSRKSFIGKLLGDVPVDERLEGTAGAVAWLVALGVHVLRVHDVGEMVRVIRVVEGIRSAT